MREIAMAGPLHPTAREFNRMHAIVIDYLGKAADRAADRDKFLAGKFAGAIVQKHGLSHLEPVEQCVLERREKIKMADFESDVLDLLHAGLLKNEEFKALYLRQKGLQPHHLDEPMHKRLLVFLRWLHREPAG